MLEQKMDGIYQREKVNNICIYGLPEENNENLNAQILTMINKYTNLEYKMEYISKTYQIGKQNDVNNKSRPAIVQLSGYHHKMDILEMQKSLKVKKYLLQKISLKTDELCCLLQNLHLVIKTVGHLMVKSTLK